MEKKIKEHFNTFEATYRPEHWAMMQERLEIEELANFTQKEDDRLDAYIQKEISSNEVPYNHAHWQMMAVRLEERTWKRAIVRFKILEASLILLLFLTSISVFDSLKYDTGEIGSLSQNNLSIKSVDQSIISPSQNIAKKAYLDESAQKTKRLQTGAQLQFLPKELKEVKSVIIAENPSLNIFKPTKNAIQSQVAKTNKLVDYTELSKYYGLNGIQPSLRSASKNFFRLGVFGSTAIDQHAADIENDPKEENTYGLSVGGGLSFSWQFKQFEIETGAAYNSITTLTPDNNLVQNLNLNKLNQSNVEEVSEKYLRLPLALKYLFSNAGTWKFYALGGGNLHINLNSSSNQSLAEQDLSAVGAKLAISATSADATKIQDSFFNRLYYTANIGIGIEKHLTKTLSVFAQPEYFHQLFKPAISNDRGITNTFAISIGMKTAL